MSALRSRAGPEVVEMLTPISTAMMLARVVLPSPGGPASSTWSSGSPRDSGGLDEDRRAARAACGCPTKRVRASAGAASPSSSWSSGASSGLPAVLSGALDRCRRSRSPTAFVCVRRLTGVPAERLPDDGLDRLVGIAPWPAACRPRRASKPSSCSAARASDTVRTGRPPADAGAPPGRGLVAHLVLELQDKALGRLLADARHGLERRPRRPRRAPAARRRAGATRARPEPAWARSCSRPGTAGRARAPPRSRSRRAAARPRGPAGG